MGSRGKVWSLRSLSNFRPKLKIFKHKTLKGNWELPTNKKLSSHDNWVKSFKFNLLSAIIFDRDRKSKNRDTGHVKCFIIFDSRQKQRNRSTIWKVIKFSVRSNVVLNQLYRPNHSRVVHSKFGFVQRVRPITSFGSCYNLTKNALNKFAKFHELWPGILTFWASEPKSGRFGCSAG